jgi:hypothetical protein
MMGVDVGCWLLDASLQVVGDDDEADMMMAV